MSAFAARYDESAADGFDPPVVDPVVDFLVGLTDSGTALEPGVETGRIARPPAERGLRVHGIELSKRWWRNCARNHAAKRSA